MQTKKKNKKQEQRQGQVQVKVQKQEKAQVKMSLTLLDKSDSFFARYEWIWFWALFGITLLTGILLFDPRVSPGGDDSAYIIMAHDFLNDFTFPGFMGPLYPMVLSVIEIIFGMSVKAFKIFSMLSILGCVYFIFMAFRKHVPSTLLFITLALTSFNSHVLYFASQTYSEAFYMFMQSLLMFVFFKFFVDNEDNCQSSIINQLKRHLLLAVVLLGAVMTRSAGYSLFVAIMGYFLLYRQWKNLALCVVCFVACFAAYQISVNIIWNDIPIQASGQANSLLNKDYYKPELGREDLAGFIDRFWTNSDQYISRFFMVMVGLRDNFTSDGFYVNTIPAITVIVYLLGLTGLWFSYRQNRYLFFSGVVAGISLIVTFVILQSNWNQYRLIVPAFPLMLLLLFSAVYYVLKLPKLRSFQFLILVPAIILFFSTLSDTSEASAKAGKLKNEYSGLTPDWLHYAKASEWSAKNLPKDALVACRKPSISSIYGKGKKFYGVYSVRSGNFDAFYERWKADSLSFSLVSLEGMSDQMYGAMLGHIEARVFLGEKYYFAVSDMEFLQQFSTYFGNVETVSSPSEFEQTVNQDGSQKSVYYPDSLLAPLRDRNVTHILTAKLRLNPNIKDGQTINTVERVALFIQEKYPSIFSRVIQIGDPDNEPADIYKINWETVNND